MTAQTKFKNPDVSAAFATFPQAVRDRLLSLREMIFEVSSKTDGVGELEETLKWGAPSYLTSQTKSGSTIRIAPFKSSEDKYALFVHCQTTLLETFRQLYPDEFSFEGKRALVFDVSEKLPADPLKHCIALALTYHQRK